MLFVSFLRDPIAVSDGFLFPNAISTLGEVAVLSLVKLPTSFGLFLAIEVIGRASNLFLTGSLRVFSWEISGLLIVEPKLVESMP